MRSIGSMIVVGALMILLFIGARAVLGEEKQVSGTKHDVATPGTPACAYCHVQQDPEGQVLWARKPNTTGTFSGLKPLCFSCHDGTVTPVGVYVFDPTRPEHVRKPGVRGQDCDRCHDPHEPGYGKFIKLPSGANFCHNCHFRAGPTDHPIDVDAMATGVIPHDKDWDPDQGDYSGTRLWNMEGTGPGNFVKCLTCHGPHGGVPGTEINTMAFESAREAFMPLCLNCHFGEEGY